MVIVSGSREDEQRGRDRRSRLLDIPTIHRTDLMSSPRSRRGVPPRVLRALAGDLAERIDTTDASGGSLWSLRGSARQPTASLERRLTCPEDLFGFVAPHSWRGVAVMLPGTARRESDLDAPLPATIAFVSDRSGGTEIAIAFGDRVAVATTHDEGFVVDVVRRVLGLPTSADVESPTSLVVAVWLQTLLDLAADPATASSLRTWRSVLAVHPAWLIAGDALPLPTDIGTLDPDELADLTATLGRTLSWERLRSFAADRTIEVPGLTPGDASWMDWPFFARWTLDVHRSATELLDDLSLFLDGPLLRDVRYTAEAAGWLGFADRRAS